MDDTTPGRLDGADETKAEPDNAPLAQEYPDPSIPGIGHHLEGGLPHLGHGE